MPEIIVVGMGPGPVEMLTLEAQRVLSLARHVYFRYSGHPVFEWVRRQGIETTCFDQIYNQPGISYDRIHNLINKALVKVAHREGQCVYALPGHPLVFEKGMRWLTKAAAAEKVEVQFTLGLSFLELLWELPEAEPEEGLLILNASRLIEGRQQITTDLTLVIGQVGLPLSNRPGHGESNLQALADLLAAHYPAEHPVTLVWPVAVPDSHNLTKTFALFELAGQSTFIRTLATLVVPPRHPRPGAAS